MGEEYIRAELGDLDGNDLMQFAYQIATGMVSRNICSFGSFIVSVLDARV